MANTRPLIVALLLKVVEGLAPWRNHMDRASVCYCSGAVVYVDPFKKCFVVSAVSLAVCLR